MRTRGSRDRDGSVSIRGAAGGRTARLLLPSPGPHCGRFHVMPNIKQQKKRVRTASQERLENLRYASTVKTFTRRLRAAVADGDRDRVDAEHRELVRQIDKAVSKGALHRNAAARKKAQAARLVSSGSS
jgi:small subunit ribosomal protein S20